MNCEIRTDIYTPPCVKQPASGELLRNTGSSALCSGMMRRGGRGGVGGRPNSEGMCAYTYKYIYS